MNAFSLCRNQDLLSKQDSTTEWIQLQWLHSEVKHPGFRILYKNLDTVISAQNAALLLGKKCLIHSAEYEPMYTWKFVLTELFSILCFFPSRCVVIYSWRREICHDFCKCVARCLCRVRARDVQSVFSMLNPLVSTVVTGGDLLDFHMKGIPHKLANVGSVRWRIEDLLSMVISAASLKMSLGRWECLVQIIWSLSLAHIQDPQKWVVEDCICHENIPFSAFPQLVSSESANQILLVEEQIHDNKIEQLSSFQKKSMFVHVSEK